MKVKMYFLMGFIFTLSFSFVAAGIMESVNNVCFAMRSIMPLIALTLFIIAALIFGIGKVLGQEYRSKTEKWAMTILIGSILGLLLALASPFIIGMIYEAMDPSGYLEFTCEEYME